MAGSPEDRLLQNPRRAAQRANADRAQVRSRRSADGRSLWVFRRGEVPAWIFSVDVATGRESLWKTLVPPDAAGVYSIDELKVTPSQDAYFYSYRRTLSELYEARGLR